MFAVIGDCGNCFYNGEIGIKTETETLDFFRMGIEGGDEIKIIANENNNENIVKVEDVDVEEGEISDTASVEEISEEDFNKQEVERSEKVNEPSTAPTSTTTASTANANGNGTANKGNGNRRVWTMDDLYRYSMEGGHVAGLYNLAWAKAVQGNKPGKTKPEDVVVVLDDKDSRRSSPSSSVNSNNNNNTNKNDDGADKVVIDVSGDDETVNNDNVNDCDNSETVVDAKKEEGELEEGEIDFDMDVDDKVSNGDVFNGDGDSMMIFECGDVVEILKSMTVTEANKSFDAVCLKLCNTLESLRESNVPIKDAVKQMSLTAVRVISSVFSSLNDTTREQYKDSFSRLATLVHSCVPSLFTSEHVKELEAIHVSQDSSRASLSSMPSGLEKETLIASIVNDKGSDVFGRSTGQDLGTTYKLSTDSLVNSKANVSLEIPKSGASTYKNRAILLPLLDLHKDHDADSLPSPTREATAPVSVQRVVAPKLVLDTGNSRMYPYETDALKAVSSYQQKFSRSTFSVTDRLPSPTPSEESGDGDGDIGGEVSSSSTINNFRPPSTVNLGQAVASNFTPLSNSSSMPVVAPIKIAAPVSSAPKLAPKPSAKSRDPRLRFVNSDSNATDQNRHALPVASLSRTEPVGGILNLKRQKLADDPVLDSNSLKRQRSAMENSGLVRDVKPMVGNGGWLEDSDTITPRNRNINQLVDNAMSDTKRITVQGVVPSSSNSISIANIGGNGQIPVSRVSAPIGSEQAPIIGAGGTSLPDLLKNIAVNPTMLLNILKMGQQQQLALEAQQKPVDSVKSTANILNLNSILRTGPAVGAPTLQLPAISTRPAGTVQVPPQLSAMDDLGKIRMKPRDPRRVLHSYTLQRMGSMGSEQLKTNVTSSLVSQETKESQNLQKQVGQGETKAVSSQALTSPDISMPFTKGLRTISNIVPVSQSSTSLPLVNQNIPSQSMRIATSSSDQPARVGTAPGVTAGPPPKNMWGEFERIFGEMSNQQKAAFQRERARRLDEQKKLLSARKLCLVLDLDHTLLNSAKFGEVDPAHDEILRKKEEQDREKSQRHLFCFAHMGMWTKLRPGIWNFLEKASKLYELHLYTMGNKLYATEMAKVLDPTGTLFNGRVISRGDDGEPFDGDERVPKSKDLEGVLGMESGVVIIDDSVRVWPHHKNNLIVVERYIYFPCSRRQFGLLGPSLLEIDHDERPEDGTLACSLSVIERIHEEFFRHSALHDADVRSILESVQKKILSGCCILFSRVIPVGEAKPHLHPLWQTAEQFGATCKTNMDDKVTHVVANSLGTDKVNWALSTGRFVVYPGWVEASALLYRRANEQDFTVKT